MKKNRYNQRNQFYMLYILIGIILGCILCCVLLQSNQGYITDFLFEKEAAWFCDVSNGKLFFYLLKKRIVSLFLFLCLSCLFSPQSAFMIFLFLWGGYYGLFISMTMYYKNIDMIAEALLCFFPHSILYFFALLCVVNLFSSSNTYCAVEEKSKKKKIIKYFLKIFVIIFCVVTGILFEINSKIFLKSFFINI